LFLFYGDPAGLVDVVASVVVWLFCRDVLLGFLFLLVVCYR